MLLVNIIAALFSASSVTAVPQRLFSRDAAFNWGSEKVRGLNIGGWLVLEPFITPSIFRNLDQSLGIRDEYTLGEKLGSDAAYQILKPHWDTWVTLQDFQKIAAAGFNTVRIPIGYWAYTTVPGEPYTPGAAPYLDKAIDWARATGLKVWIDLHGAPGSQNGFDNSGHLVSTLGWGSGDTVAVTLSVLNTISTKYAQPAYQDTVVGIELLNEPFGPKLNIDTIKKFYRDGYNQVRAIGDTAVIIHDAFTAPKNMNGVLSVSDNNAQKVVVDHHEYQVFDNNLIALSPSQHLKQVCDSTSVFAQGADKWIVVGEWTAALTDCATYLNGYLSGARYDGTYPDSKYVGSCDDKRHITNWSETFREDVRNFLEAQLSAYESQTQGWIFWNFKTEDAHEWDAFALLDAGIFPQPLTNIKTSICA